MAYPYTWANTRGIPRLEATGVTVNTNNVVYNFNTHRSFNFPFAGLILLKLPSYTAPATAVPVVFESDRGTQTVTTLDGAAVTSAELSSSGIYLAYYDGSVLQILTGI